MDINNLWSEYDLNSKKQNTRCLAVNTILEGKYLVGPLLGQGGFGITYVGYDLNMETKIAIKEYFPVELVSRDTTTMHGDRVLSLSGEKSVTYKAGLKKYVAEAQNVSQFSEIPGVVSVKDFFYANETAYIVMEYIDGISLKDYLKEKGGSLSEEETLKIMKPVLEALVQVHQSGIIHRDISPDNIMLTFQDENVHNQIESVKLIDFGAARMTEKNDQKSLTIILKHGYAPEEQYRTHGEQGTWTDVYALCAVLYRMLTGETPVPAMDRMFKDELKTLEQCGVKVSANTSAAILKGLAVKKDNRIESVQKLIDALYKGVKIKDKAGAGKFGKNKMGLYAGIGAAVVVCIAGVMILSGNKAGSAKNEQEIVAIKDTADTVTEIEGQKIAFEEKSDLGETIVYRNPQTCVSGGSGEHILICKPDGSVQALGSNGYGQCMVEEWSDIVAVASSSNHSLGLRSDGKVFAVGDNRSGQCDVENWSNVLYIAAGSNTSFGLTIDGVVLGVGRNYNGVLEQIAEWTNIKAITAGVNDTLIGLDYDGNLHYAGNEETWTAISGWQDVTHISHLSENLFGLKDDGSYVAVKLYEDAPEHLLPYVGSENDIQQICLNYPILGVNKEGKVFSWASHEVSGVDTMEATLSKWNNMEAIVSAGSMDRIYIVGLKKDGTMIEHIQCAGNSSPEEMKNLEWIDTMEAYGYTNLVGKTKDGKLLTYGLEYFRMEDYANLSDRGIVNVSEIIDIVGMDTVLMSDGRLFYCGHFSDGFNNSSFAENVKQALDIGPMMAGLFAVLTEEGTVEFKVIVDDNNLTPEYLARIESAKEWSDVVQIEGTDYTLFGLHEDGSVSMTDRGIIGDGFAKIECNEYASRTLNELIGIRKNGTADVILSTDASEAYGRTQITTWDNLKDISLGESHVVGLKNDGTVIAAGSNHVGQCDVEEWTDVIFLTTGENCTLGITASGNLLMAGSLY